jgi:O-antigen/teichoic acid export membrane protein
VGAAVLPEVLNMTTLLRTASRILTRSKALLMPSGPHVIQPDHGRSRERYRRAGLSAASALGGRGLSLTLSLLTVPLTLNYLGPERYGMWLTISSMIALLAFTDLGIGNGLLNSVTRAMARGDPMAVKREISSGAVLLTSVALAIGLIFAETYSSVPWARLLAVTSRQAISEAGPSVAAWMGCFLLGLPLSVATQVRRARQEGYVVNLMYACGNVVAVVALLIAIHTRQGVPALVIVMAAPPLIATALSGLLLFGRDVPSLTPSLGSISGRTAIRLLRSGSLFLVIQLAMAFAFTSDTIVIAQIVGPSGVAEYGVASKLFLIPASAVAITLSPLWPAYGEAIARGDIDWARSTLARSLKGALLVAIPAATVLVFFGQAIIRLWVGTSVMPPFSLLLGLGLWIVLSAIGNSIANFLNGAHEMRIQAGATSLMAALNLGLSIFLTQRIGVAGVIWGTVLAYTPIVLIPMAIYVPHVLERLEARSGLH